MGNIPRLALFRLKYAGAASKSAAAIKSGGGASLKMYNHAGAAFFIDTQATKSTLDRSGQVQKPRA